MDSFPFELSGRDSRGRWRRTKAASIRGGTRTVASERPRFCLRKRSWQLARPGGGLTSHSSGRGADREQLQKRESFTAAHSTMTSDSGDVPHCHSRSEARSALIRSSDSSDDTQKAKLNKRASRATAIRSISHGHPSIGKPGCC